MKNVSNNARQEKAEQLQREKIDIDTFTGIYIPQICRSIHELYGQDVISMMLNKMCLTAEESHDVYRCLEQIRGCFRLVNRRYPLDLKVYEDTETGRVLLVQLSLTQMSKYLYSVADEPLFPEDVQDTHEKEKKS